MSLREIPEEGDGKSLHSHSRVTDVPGAVPCSAHISALTPHDNATTQVSVLVVRKGWPGSEARHLVGEGALLGDTVLQGTLGLAGELMSVSSKEAEWAKPSGIRLESARVC